MSFLSGILSVSTLSCESSWLLSLVYLIWIGSIQPTSGLITSSHYLSLVTHLLLMLLLCQLCWCQVKIINNIRNIRNSTVSRRTSNIVDLLSILVVVSISTTKVSTTRLKTFGTLFLLLLLKFLISQIYFLLLDLLRIKLFPIILILSPWIN